jgi:hypothetical protein
MGHECPEAGVQAVTLDGRLVFELELSGRARPHLPRKMPRCWRRSMRSPKASGTTLRILAATELHVSLPPGPPCIP